jgi:hypothetical protein
LGLPAAAVAEHHRAGRTALGLSAEDSDLPHCAGWPMVSRDGSALTPAERTAAAGHLGLCRRCRDGLAARRRTRTALQASGALGGGGVAAAAAVVIESLVTSAGTATVAGGIGIVGGLGIVGGVDGGHLPADLPFIPHHVAPARSAAKQHIARSAVGRKSPDTGTPASGQRSYSEWPSPTSIWIAQAGPSSSSGSSSGARHPVTQRKLRKKSPTRGSQHSVSRLPARVPQAKPRQSPALRLPSHSSHPSHPSHPSQPGLSKQHKRGSCLPSACGPISRSHHLPRAHYHPKR